MMRRRGHPSRPSHREAVANGANKGSPSLDDASRRQENHEASSGATSFETRAKRAPQDEGLLL